LPSRAGHWKSRAAVRLFAKACACSTCRRLRWSIPNLNRLRWPLDLLYPQFRATGDAALRRNRLLSHGAAAYRPGDFRRAAIHTGATVSRTWAVGRRSTPTIPSPLRWRSTCFGIPMRPGTKHNAFDGAVKIGVQPSVIIPKRAANPDGWRQRRNAPRSERRGLAGIRWLQYRARVLLVGGLINRLACMLWLAFAQLIVALAAYPYAGMAPFCGDLHYPKGGGCWRHSRRRTFPNGRTPRASPSQ